jgi:hypothetical protein
VELFIVERSTDRVNFTEVNRVPGRPVLNEEEAYASADDISGISKDVIYYRLKSVIRTSGRVLISNIIAVRLSAVQGNVIKVMPNPVHDQMQVAVTAPRDAEAVVYVHDAAGRVVFTIKEQFKKGNNTVIYRQTSTLPDGVYYLRIQMGEILLTERFKVQK